MHTYKMYRRRKSHEPPGFYSTAHSPEPPTLCLWRYLQLPPQLLIGPKTRNIVFSTFYSHVFINSPFPPRPFPDIHRGKVSGKPLPLRSIGWPTMPSLASPQKAQRGFKKKTHTDFSCCLLIGAFVWQLYVTWYYVYICWLFYMKHYINWLVGFCPWTLGSSPNIFTAQVNKLSRYKELKMLNDWMRQSGIPDKIDSRQSACMLSSKTSSPDSKSFCTWSKLHADLWQVTVFWSIISNIILFLTVEWHVEIQIIGFKTHEQCYTKWFGLDGFQVCILTILWMSRSTECSYSNNWTNLPGTTKKNSYPFGKVIYHTLGKGKLCSKVPLG